MHAPTQQGLCVSGGMHQANSATPQAREVALEHKGTQFIRKGRARACGNTHACAIMHAVVERGQSWVTSSQGLPGAVCSTPQSPSALKGFPRHPLKPASLAPHGQAGEQGAAQEQRLTAAHTPTRQRISHLVHPAATVIVIKHRRWHAPELIPCFLVHMARHGKLHHTRRTPSAAVTSQAALHVSGRENHGDTRHAVRTMGKGKGRPVATWSRMTSRPDFPGMRMSKTITSTEPGPDAMSSAASSPAHGATGVGVAGRAGAAALRGNARGAQFLKTWGAPRDPPPPHPFAGKGGPQRRVGARTVGQQSDMVPGHANLQQHAKAHAAVSGFVVHKRHPHVGRVPHSDQPEGDGVWG